MENRAKVFIVIKRLFSYDFIEIVKVYNIV